MYEGFYGFRERPFSLTPNPRYVYYSTRYRDSLDALLYGLERKEGFLLLTGSPGTGKTTLCREMLDKLDRGRFSSALLFNPFLNGVEMLQALLTEYRVAYSVSAPRTELLNKLNRFLLDELAAGRSCVAVFDEAQHLSTEFLEQVRVLSNLETAEEKLIQIVLVGQPELLHRMHLPGLAQLEQRVSVRSALAFLDRGETQKYIEHRLNVAGAQGRVIFTPAAIRKIRNASGGIPRRINAICDQALLAGYVHQTRDIGSREVKRAIESLKGGEADPSLVRKPIPRWAAAVIALAALTALAAAGLLLAVSYPDLLARLR